MNEMRTFPSAFQRMPLRPPLSSAFSSPRSKARLIQNTTIANAANPTPRFAAAIMPNQVGGMLKRLDFKEMGQSHVNQIQIIYLTCILARLGAAYYRSEKSPTKSRNEIREGIVRDGTGYLFWFFATPLVQRLFLKYGTPAEYRPGLLQKTPEPPKGDGFISKLKHLNWRFNPLAGDAIPTSRQVENQKEQALQGLKEAGVSVQSDTYKKMERYYKGLMKYRHFATGIGLGMTIALIGIGINLLNFYMTRTNVAKRQANAQPQPTAPNQPTPSANPSNGFTTAIPPVSAPTLPVGIGMPPATPRAY